MPLKHPIYTQVSEYRLNRLADGLGFPFSIDGTFSDAQPPCGCLGQNRLFRIPVYFYLLLSGCQEESPGARNSNFLLRLGNGGGIVI